MSKTNLFLYQCNYILVIKAALFDSVNQICDINDFKGSPYQLRYFIDAIAVKKISLLDKLMTKMLNKP